MAIYMYDAESAEFKFSQLRRHVHLMPEAVINHTEISLLIFKGN